MLQARDWSGTLCIFGAGITCFSPWYTERSGGISSTEHSGICGCSDWQFYGTIDLLLGAKHVQGISPDSCAKDYSYLPSNLILYSRISLARLFFQSLRVPFGKCSAIKFMSSLGENCSCLPEVAILPMMFSFSIICSWFFPVGVCLNILSSFNAGLVFFFKQWVIFSRLLCMCCF